MSSEAAAAETPGFLRRVLNKATEPFWLGCIGAAGVGLVASFQITADCSDFFKYSFITTKDTDAIVDFYSTEDFLQILGVVPWGLHFVLAGVEWDTKAENTMAVWNVMQISFDITEKEETIDGKDVVTLFNKRERFINYVPFTHWMMWDQVQNYGYRRLPDGRIEVSHQGEHFYGPWPIRLLVGLHAMYVIWATEKHINSPVFGVGSLEEQEHQRSNIPLHVAKEWLETLQKSQETTVAKSRLQRTKSVLDREKHEENQKTLNTLKKLQRTNTVISVERKFDGTVKIKADDPEAQAAIKRTLKDIKTSQGNEAAAKALDALLKNPEVQKHTAK